MNRQQRRDKRLASGDRYWRRSISEDITKRELKDILRQKSHKFRSRDNKDTLLEKVQRVDLEQVLYNECAFPELYRFAVDRKLLSRQALYYRPMSKEDLINLLETDDEAATFTRLFDLPPELRANIFAEYLGAFPDFLECPTQPPLTRASKQLRQEALPTFYSTAGFTIPLQVHSIVDFDQTCWGYLQNLVVNGHLGCIRSLRLKIRQFFPNDRLYNLDVRGSEKAFHISVSRDLRNDVALPMQLTTDLEREFRLVFEEVNARDEKDKMKLEDIYKIRRKLEELLC